MITKIRECDDALVELRAVLFEPALGVPNVTLLQHLNTCRSCRAILLLLMAETQPDGVPPASCAECLADLAAFIDVVRANPSAASEYPAVWWHLWLCPSCSETYQLTLELLDAQPRELATLAPIRLEGSLVHELLQRRTVPLLAARGADDQHVLFDAVIGDDLPRLCTIVLDAGDDAGLRVVVQLDPASAGVVELRCGELCLHGVFSGGQAVLAPLPADLLDAPDRADIQLFFS